MSLHRVRLSLEDTRREAQGPVLLQNQAERQERPDRKLPQVKLEPVTRLGQALGKAGSSPQGAWAKAEGRTPPRRDDVEEIGKRLGQASVRKVSSEVSSSSTRT